MMFSQEAASEDNKSNQGDIRKHSESNTEKAINFNFTFGEKPSDPGIYFKKDHFLLSYLIDNQAYTIHAESAEIAFQVSHISGNNLLHYLLPNNQSLSHPNSYRPPIPR